MIKLGKRLFYLNTNSNWLIFILLIIIYGIFTRMFLENISMENQVQYNFWDIFFGIHADIFFLMYILIPVWIVISLKIITDEWNPNILIRLSSYKNWLIHNLINSIHYTLVIQGLIIACSWSISFQFPIENQWSTYSQLNISTKEMSLSNNTPLYFAIIQILYLSLFFISSFLFLALVFQFLQKKIWLYGLGFVMYISILILYKYTFDYYYLNVINYMSVLNSYKIFPSLIYPFLFYLILLMVILLVGRLKNDTKESIF
ncbi:hypothetical protein [Sporosarcina sp. HYO08]|uniref:hypothetical protein n=1 Tax=Sporosarcina sp. HYO08 TaxID=1759557 RepID=UPI0007972157|nr:hypothetical protein [Sporosarcina sp. HYO08]KXH83747.1 hypothetical protein AU377_02980 [Sporosarcina sp. HYO08]